MASKGKKAAVNLTTQLWNAVRGCDIMKAESILDSNTRTSEEGGGNVSVHSAGKIDFDKKMAGKNILIELASRKCEYEEDDDPEVDEDFYATTFQEVIQNIIIYGGRDLAQETVGGKNAFELAYESGNFYVVKALCDEDDLEINPGYATPDKVIAGYNFQLKLPPGDSRKMDGRQMSWFNMLKGNAEKRKAKLARPDPIRNRLIEAGYKRGSAEYLEMYELEQEHERDMAAGKFNSNVEEEEEPQVAAAAAVAAPPVSSKPKLIVKGPKQIAAEREALGAVPVNLTALPKRSATAAPHTTASAAPPLKSILKSSSAKAAPSPNAVNEVANALVSGAKAAAAAGGASAASLLAASMPELPKAQLQVMTVRQLAAAKARSLLAKMQAEKQDVLFLRYIADGNFNKALDAARTTDIKVADEARMPIILLLASKRPTNMVESYKQLVALYLEKEPQYIFETSAPGNNDRNNAFVVAFNARNAPFLAAYIDALRTLPDNEYRRVLKEELAGMLEGIDGANYPNILLGKNVKEVLESAKNLRGGRRKKTRKITKRR